MNKRNKILIIISIILIILIILGGTLALWTWNSSENKNIVFNTASDLQDYIIYDEGESKFVGDFQVSDSYLDGVHTTISLYKTEEVSNVDLYATINMDINSIGTNLKSLPGLKWVVTSGNSTDSNHEVLSQGNFLGTNDGDTLVLYNNIEVLTTKKEFTIWLWLDSSTNLDSELTGERIDTSVWTQINQIVEDRYEITNISAYNKMISATVVNSTANIMYYQVTTSNTEPIEWIEIPEEDIGNIYTLEYNSINSGTNYVWFKDSNNKVISKDIFISTVYNITYLDVGGTTFSGIHDEEYPQNYNTGSITYLDMPIKEGYSFSGYYLNSDGSGEVITNISDSQTGDITLYAKWIDNVAPYGVASLSLNNGVFTLSLSDYGDKGSGINDNYGFSLMVSGDCKNAMYEYQNTLFKEYSAELVVGSTYYGCIKISDNNNNINYIKTIGITYSGMNILTNYNCANETKGDGIYALNYTGNCSVISDGTNNWKVKFLTSGKLTINRSEEIDAFLVGGGGGGGTTVTGGDSNGSCGGGGGGGYTTTSTTTIISDYEYEIVIGSGGARASAGGTTTAFGLSALGGQPGTNYYATYNGGGSGGSGGGGYTVSNNTGAGGYNGGNGSNGAPGQGSTTREFGESDGTLYAGGGGGGLNRYSGSSGINYGGAGGGGNGASVNATSTSGEDNTGGGGGGGNQRYGSSAGGSGIVVIRGKNQSQNYTSIILTYDNTGGNGCYSKSIIANKPYGTLCTPVKSGYKFDGWWTSIDGGTRVNSDMIVSNDENHTIYAHWSKATKPVITFENDGNTEYVNSEISSRIIVTKGDSVLDTTTFKYTFSKDSNAEPTNSFINGNTYSLNEGEGIYYLIADACDINGECTRKVSEPFYLDTVSPNGILELSTTNNTVTANVKATDNGSGIKNYGYLIQATSNCPTIGYIESGNPNYTFNLTEAGVYYICVKIKDNAGNYNVVKTGVKYEEPDVYLFNEGNDNSDLTGGWSGSGTSTTTSGGGISGNVLYARAYYGSSSSDALGRFYTNNKIDLTNYDTLHFLVTKTTANLGKAVGYGLSQNYSDFVNSVSLPVSLSTPTEYILDISNVEGLYYISGFTRGAGLVNELEVSKIWLTRSDNITILN